LLAEQILRTTRNSADVRHGKRDWFRFTENKAADETRVDIYDEIGWFGITAHDFINELRTVTTRNISLHINSVGGDVFDGLAIHNALKQHDARVNVTVDGIAASIASIISMAGDNVTMADGSLMMIHEPFTLAIGDAEDMHRMGDALNKMGDSLADIYALRAGGTRDEWRGVMRSETWYTAQEAVAAGLADKASSAPATKNTFDLSIFRNYRAATARSEAPPVVANHPTGSETDWRSTARLKVVAAMEDMVHAKAG